MEPANLLKIKTLDEGWCDKDHVMLHACFQLLSDFVEQELPLFPGINWNVSADMGNAIMKGIEFNAAQNSEAVPMGTRDIKKEIEELYAWWQERKDDKIMDRSASFEESHVIYQNDNDMLKRLIDIRMFLWT